MRVERETSERAHREAWNRNRPGRRNTQSRDHDAAPLEREWHFDPPPAAAGDRHDLMPAVVLAVDLDGVGDPASKRPGPRPSHPASCHAEERNTRVTAETRGSAVE
jgi:hypothetical protein